MSDLTKAPPDSAPVEQGPAVVPLSLLAANPPNALEGRDGLMAALSAAEQLVAESPSVPWMVRAQMSSTAWAVGAHGVEVAFRTAEELRAFAAPRGAAVSEWLPTGLPETTVHFEAVGAVRVGDRFVPFRGSALENRPGGAS